MCSELEFSKSTYLLYSPVCHVVCNQVRQIDCTWCTKLLTCNSAIITTTSLLNLYVHYCTIIVCMTVTVMRNKENYVT